MFVRTVSRLAMEHKILVQWVPGLYRPGVKRPECEFQSNADVKNACSCTVPQVLHGVVVCETLGKILSYVIMGRMTHSESMY